MRLKLPVYLGLALFCSWAVRGQESPYHTDNDQDYRKGLELYNNGKYSAAQQFLDRYAELHPNSNSEQLSNSSYFAAMCAIRLLNNDAESRAVKFLNENTDNPLSNHITFSLAGYFYQRRSYNNALQYYELVDERKLTEVERPEFYFMSGYCYFLRENYEQARYQFSQVKDGNSKYAAPALYYYSHINYTENNYETALEGFLRLREDENFGPIVPYYVTQIYFKQEKYDEVVEYAPSLLGHAAESRMAEVAGIIGSSYMQLGLYEEAIPYLEQYVETSRSVSREHRYELAYAYYKTGAFEKAAELFSQISGSSSILSQNALYHLADCQIRLNEKNKARMAFSSASKMDFDQDIKEDALLNYALLTYELDYSPFNEAIQALNDYITQYPNAKRSDEAYNYLVTAYLNAKNYRLALASLDKIRDKNNEMKRAYQKIAYYRGLELFSNLNLNEAIEMFDESIRYGIFEPELHALSLYWKGEALYRLGDYTAAIEQYRSFLSQPGTTQYDEYSLGCYSLAYCYFNLRQYSDARVWFSKFTGLAGNQRGTILSDAYNRLGDCYYVQTDYANAVSYYDNAGKQGAGSTDYAIYQKALALGAAGRNTEKLTTLDQLLKMNPGSSYKPDALFQMADTYVKLNQNDRAINTFNEIINNYPTSSYVKKSLLNLGLLFFNTGRENESIRSYKEVVENYPGSDEAENALLGLKNVYIDMNKSDEYFSYIGELGILSSEDLAEQDALSFTAAERLYMSGDYTRASQNLESYIKNHPDGRFLINAHFYKGDCHYRASEFDKALQDFNYVINQTHNSFTEQALLGASRIRYRQKDYASAADYYRKLETVAENRDHLLEARFGLMRCYYLTEDYTRVPDLADKILLGESVSPDQERETRFLKAKSLLARDRQMLALEEFRSLAHEVSSVEGAESKYRVAQIYYQRGQTNEAENEISDFADRTTPHQYWMAKSFLLWADIFADRGDVFQAIQTLQSLIDYYDNSDDGIVNEAKQKQQILTERQNVTKAPAAEDQELEIELNELNIE
ncbi:MAG: tetratricopeptide repeat protein [Bacteroidales bacterium]|nr:tetratricopeptide repeat protein [Bacteroidales bacterium]